MTIYLFIGPTLSAADVQTELDAVCLPPVSQGDVYRLSLEDPWAIGIVDGYFERVPAVWHKEILWAMSRGIHVFGAASMGALRAAELAAYGMIGVGRIFDDLRDGRLLDDNEVAVVHGPEDTGYRPFSEAMVNIRATLERAAADGVIAEPLRDALVQLAKEMFYPLRSYPELLARAEARGLSPGELAPLRAWLPDGRVNQKRADALAMLLAMEQLRRADPGPKQVHYHFEHTDLWEQVGRRDGRLTLATRVRAAQIEPILDELRLAGEGAFPAAVSGAVARVLSLAEVKRQGVAPTRELLAQAGERLRADLGLSGVEAMDAWRDEQDLTADGLARLVRDEAGLRWTRTMLAPNIERAMADHLRTTGEYGRLRARALDKQRRLAACGLEEPSLEAVRLDEGALLRWFFEERLGEPVPADLDRHAERLGCPDRAALLRVLLRELCYERLLAVPAASPDES